MVSNQVADIPWADPQLASDSVGLGFAITTKAGEARKQGQAEGSFEWVGIYNTFYWVDPEKKLGAFLFTQQLPFSWKLDDKYKVAVYQALDD